MIKLIIEPHLKNKTMKHLLTIILFSTVSLLFACTKSSDSPTQAELTAQKLVTVFGSSSGTFSNGRVIYLSNNAGYVILTATTYKISSEGYITVSASGQDPITFNLEYLKDFSV